MTVSELEQVERLKRIEKGLEDVQRDMKEVLMDMKVVLKKIESVHLSVRVAAMDD